MNATSAAIRIPTLPVIFPIRSSMTTPMGREPGGVPPPPSPAGLDDERRLLGDYARGDRGAAERLVAATYRQVYAFLLKLTAGDADLAADLTQDTYRKAWDALSGFDGRSRFSTWLCRIAYTTFRNHIRRPRRIVPLEDETALEAADPEPGPEA